MPNIDNRYFAHHGILGQKWGVRRYQNLDGSLTEEGRKRNGYNSSKQLEKDLKKASKKKTYAEAVEAISKNESVREAYVKHAKELNRLKNAVFKVNTAYEIKPGIQNSRAQIRQPWRRASGWRNSRLQTPHRHLRRTHRK